MRGARRASDSAVSGAISSSFFLLRSAVAIGKPLITCCVEPGFWETWVLANSERATSLCPDAHKDVCLARLATHLFVDLGNCARVQWAGEATSAAERRALLQAPTAMPRLLKALAETRAPLAAAEDAAAQCAQSRPLSLRDKSQAALEAAFAMWSAATARASARPSCLLSGTLPRRGAAPRRRALHTWTQYGSSRLRPKLQAVLRAEKDEEKRVADAEGMRAAEARAARDAWRRSRWPP